MADIAADIVHKTRSRSEYISGPIANGVTLYIGGFAQYSTAGYVDHWDETGVFLGEVVGAGVGVGDTGALTGDTSATPVPEARIRVGHTLMHMDVAGISGATDTAILVYCADSDPANLTDTDTTNPPVGWVSYYRGDDDVDVTLFTPEEHLAGIADATWNS